MAIAGPNYDEHHAVSLKETASLDEQLRDTETGGEVFGAGLEGVIDMASMPPAMLQRLLCCQNSILNNDKNNIEIKHVSGCAWVGGGGNEVKRYRIFLIEAFQSHTMHASPNIQTTTATNSGFTPYPRERETAWGPLWAGVGRADALHSAHITILDGEARVWAVAGIR